MHELVTKGKSLFPEHWTTVKWQHIVQMTAALRYIGHAVLVKQRTEFHTTHAAKPAPELLTSTREAEREF